MIVKKKDIKFVEKPLRYGFKDLTGQRFGKLKVLGYGGKVSSSKSSMWYCKCDCKKYCLMWQESIKRYGEVSCGCYSKEKRAIKMRVHGLKGTPEYR